jgi:hypothetical protein
VSYLDCEQVNDSASKKRLLMRGANRIHQPNERDAIFASTLHRFLVGCGATASIFSTARAPFR